MSEIAGRMAPMIAGRFLMNTRGGRGILSTLPVYRLRMSSSSVAVRWAANAARAFVGIGAQVTVLDIDLRRLRQIDEMFRV